MDFMRPPAVPDDPPPVLRTEEFERLLAACSGTSFEDRRDTAIIRLLASTVMRRGECIGLRVEDVDSQVSVADVEDEAAFRPRAVHIHVCEAGSAWEREHLLFRDYLRARSVARLACAELKRDLAERYPDDRLAYTDAKSDFILDALDDAAAWAARVGWRPGS